MEGKLFVSVIRQLNPTYNDLLLAYSKQDTRISYLRSFELILSACLRDDILEKDPKYIELENQLHTHSKYHNTDIMPPKEFWMWIKNLEQIMRDEGLIGASGDGDDDLVLDMVGLDPFIAPHIKRARNGMAMLIDDTTEVEDEGTSDVADEVIEDEDFEEEASDDDTDIENVSEDDSEEVPEQEETEDSESRYEGRPLPVFGTVPGEEELRMNQFDGDPDGVEELIAANPMRTFSDTETPATEETEDAPAEESDTVGEISDDDDTSEESDDDEGDISEESDEVQAEVPKKDAEKEEVTEDGPSE